MKFQEFNKKFTRQAIGDEISLIESYPEPETRKFVERLPYFDSVAELCCNIGITSCVLAEKMGSVLGVELNEQRIKWAYENSKVYNADKKTKFIVGNVLDENILKHIKADAVLFDPYWRPFHGTSYNRNAKFVNSIDESTPSIRDVFYKTKDNITDNIIIRIPRNFTFETLKDLGKCKLENIYSNTMLRHKIAYFSPEQKQNEEVNVNYGAWWSER